MSAESIMIRPEITELFRYRSNLCHAAQLWREQRMFMSDPRTFNDPFDAGIPLLSGITPEEYRQMILSSPYYNENQREQAMALAFESFDPLTLSEDSVTRINEVGRGYESAIRAQRICCLAENHCSILMWSHYAGQHLGYCIGFRRISGINFGDGSICKPVNYTNDYPLCTLSQIGPNGDLTDALLYTKSREWEYENEWRLLSQNMFCRCADISRIIIGCAFQRENNRSELDRFLLCLHGDIVQSSRFHGSQNLIDDYRNAITNVSNNENYCGPVSDGCNVRLEIMLPVPQQFQLREHTIDFIQLRPPAHE